MARKERYGTILEENLAKRSSVFPLKEAMVNTLHQVSAFSWYHAHILAFSIRMQHTKNEASGAGTLNRKQQENTQKKTYNLKNSFISFALLAPKQGSGMSENITLIDYIIEHCNKSMAIALSPCVEGIIQECG
ncbi:MAG: phage terminase large subunit-like protein [Lentisphaeria bacterium]